MIRHLPVTLWFLMFKYLSVFDLHRLKLVTKILYHLVNKYPFSKKTMNLTKRMCNKGVWSLKLKKNLLGLNAAIKFQLKDIDDPMLILYVRYKICSLFDSLTLYHIFCCFAFCERVCDNSTTYCLICSRVYID